MEVITINWLELLVGLFIGAILAMLLTRIIFIKGLDKKSKKLDESRKKTEEEALELIGEAVKTAFKRILFFINRNNYTYLSHFRTPQISPF